MNENKIFISFTEGPRVEIVGNNSKEYSVIFRNENKQIVSRNTITNNMWCSALIRYYNKWNIEIIRENEIILNETFNLNSKRIKILIENSNVREVLSIIDIVDQFQRLHRCHIDCVVNDSDLQKTLSKSYDNISFYLNVSDSTNYYTIYKIAKFQDYTYYTKNPHDGKDFRKIAMDVLGIDIPFETDEPITLIAAHPNSQKIIDVLKSTLKRIKTKIILSVNYPVDEEVQRMCDYVVYDRDNPILKKSEYDAYSTWFFHIKPDGSKVFFEFEYSYAAYILIKNGLEMAKSLGYKKVHFQNYDYHLTDSTIKEQLEYLNTYDAVVYGGYNPNHNSGAYDSCCWAAHVDKILPVYQRYKTKFEYYIGGAGNAPCAFLELKSAYTIQSMNLNVKELDWDKLNSENELCLVTTEH